MIERIRPRSKTKVGYGRPPEATRFKKGKSGNPRGRPRGARGVAAVLGQVLRQKVAVTENGKKKWISTLEVIFRRLVNAALLSDPRALKILIPLAERYVESPEGGQHLEEMLAEDQAILSRFMQEHVGGDADLTNKPVLQRGGDVNVI